MKFVDTHCHIHEIEGSNDVDDSVAHKWRVAGVNDAQEVIDQAAAAGVEQLICVGTSVEDSEQCIAFVQKHPQCVASIGIHPHEAEKYVKNTDKLRNFRNLSVNKKVVAVGECGLDYFYTHSPKAAQIEILHMQMELALKHKMPLIFHVREAFTDFWAVYDQYQRLEGVVHSFTGNAIEMKEALDRGLYIGLNGIMTFSKDTEHHKVITEVPLQKLLLETDAPFLTPTPFRGKICRPEYVRVTAEYIAAKKGISLEELADATTTNAATLFRL